MNILMNGEIYIKKGPEPFHIDQNMQDLIADLEFESSKEDPSYQAMDYLEMYEDFKSVEGEMDYSYTEYFWVSLINNNGINMICQNRFLPSAVTRTYPNVLELNKRFMKLSDFLDKADYIGKYFIRTAPLGENKSYMNYNNDYLVLFATKDIMLVMNDFFGEPVFSMISPIYLKDGNYKFYGKQNNSYSNKTELYKLIHNQIIADSRKNRGRS